MGNGCDKVGESGNQLVNVRGVFGWGGGERME